MAKGIKEREFQNKMIEWAIPLGWDYRAGRSLPREHTQTVLAPHLREAVIRLNPKVIDNYDADAVVDEVIATVNNVPGGLVAANETVIDLLRGGKEFRDKDDEWHRLAFIDFDKPTSNNLVVADEVKISVPGKPSRRFDLVYYVNGLPLIVVEVKSPTSDSSWATAAHEINDFYVADYPWFFTPNVFCVGTDGVKLRFGAAGAPTNLWQPFRSTADDEELSGMADVQRSCELLFAPDNVLDILANFCLFDTRGGGADKKYLPRYPQKEAAHLIHQRVVAGGNRGLIWHHQGSGKTLLMVFAASLMLNDIRTDSPTIILLSDRTQIVRQTAGVFTSAMGDSHFYEPSTGAKLRDLIGRGVPGVISTTIHKFAEAGKDLSTRSNIVVMADEAHRTHSSDEESLAGQMRAALPNAQFFGMTGTPVRNLHTDTFALFGDPSDPDRVMHRYSMSRSLMDEATVPVALEAHPVGFNLNDEALQKEFDEFAAKENLDNADQATLSRSFGRLTSVFNNPGRIDAVCQHIVDHYVASVYLNGMKAQVVTYNRELAVAYTDKINEILAGFEVKQKLSEVLGADGKPRHDAITAEVNISVSDAKDEDPAMRAYRLSEAEEEDQKRRFLSPENPLSFIVVTAKLMTGFDAPNEGVLYLDKPIKAQNLFQAITRPNRTWVSPVTGYVKPRGIVVDYVGLAKEVQKAVQDPTAHSTGDDQDFVQDVEALVKEFRQTHAEIEDLIAHLDVDSDEKTYGSIRTISDFLDGEQEATKVFKRDYLLLSRLLPYVSADKRIRRYENSFGLFGAVYTTLFKQATDIERKERLAELGPMVLDIINRHIDSFEVTGSQKKPLVLDAQGLKILKELLAVVPDPKGTEAGSDAPTPPSASEILDRIKEALDKGVDPNSAKYTALAKRLRSLRDRAIKGAQEALDFLTDALRLGEDIMNAQKESGAVVVDDEDHVGVLSRIIADYKPEGLSITERRFAEEIDKVALETLRKTYDNAEARDQAVGRRANVVFTKYGLKPYGEPYDSALAYIRSHYLVD